MSNWWRWLSVHPKDACITSWSWARLRSPGSSKLRLMTGWISTIWISAWMTMASGSNIVRPWRSGGAATTIDNNERGAGGRPTKAIRLQKSARVSALEALHKFLTGGWDEVGSDLGHPRQSTGARSGDRGYR